MMQGSVTKERGAALIVVLSLLTISLMVGLSSMQSSQIDERLAGNYKAAAEAQMAAERAASEALKKYIESPGNINFKSSKNLDGLDKLKKQRWVGFENVDWLDPDQDICSGQVECRYGYVLVNGGNYIVAMGFVDNAMAESDPVVVEVGGGPGGGIAPFNAAVNACEDVTMTGSGDVEGGIKAVGNVSFNGGVSPPDAVSTGGSVIYPSRWQDNTDYMEAVSGYSQGGDVFPQGCDVVSIRKEDGSVGEFYNNVLALPGKQSLGGWFDSVGCSHCYDEKNNGFVLTGDKGNNDAATTVVGSQGEVLTLEVDNNFGAQGRLSNLLIKGDVTLVVNGDFDIGNNVMLTVDEGSSLSIYSTGGVRLSGGTSVSASGGFVRETPSGKSKPALSIYSVNEQSVGSPNIIVGGNNHSQVVIYAPYSDIRVTGSGKVAGSLWGRNVELSGSGAVEFFTGLSDYIFGDGEPGGGHKWM